LLERDDAVLRGPRVLLRQWRPSDRDAFAAMNADPEVMRHFVAPLTVEQSAASANWIAEHLQSRGYGWWVLQTPALEFAGCVGLVDVKFELPGLDGPQVEIGWRLVPAAWGQGYASEAAARCLAHARDVLNLVRVVSFTTLGNLKSMAVMQRIGMVEIGRFEHPRVPLGHPIRPHVLYSTV
jgi:RimJ/RimL family protein N-acetyltransferase